MKRNLYFSLEKANQTATLNIYGDICSWAWEELGETNAVILSKQLEALGDVNEIHVFINSYGGEVAEGLAIYNALKRHNAKVITYCDGFACSIASVIFMAGDERVMNEASLLMIHNAWTYAIGNSTELRKQADDLEKITQASVEAYKAHSSLSEEEIKSLMDAESWILPEEALSYGFATRIEKTEKANASQNAFKKLFEIIMAYQAEKDEETDEEEPDDTSAEDDTEDTSEEPTDETPEDTDDETTEDETEESKEEDSDDEKQETTTQKWSGFFNALLNLN